MRDELSILTHSNLIRPHLICWSEHHMREQEITNLSLSNYRLPSSFCRECFKGGYMYYDKEQYKFQYDRFK